MSELIPTTAGVRDAYSAESSDSSYANRMFDAWLAKYKAKTIAKERERILKLLETEKFSLPAGLEGGTTYIPIEELIALIKGEQK